MTDCFTHTYWDHDMWICSTQTTRGSDCVSQGLKLKPFDSETDKREKKKGLISACEWPHVSNTMTQNLTHFLHYHPDTKPLLRSYQTKQTQKHTQAASSTPNSPGSPNKPRLSSSHARVSRSTCWSIGVWIIRDYGILSASPPSNTHSHTLEHLPWRAEIIPISRPCSGIILIWEYWRTRITVKTAD